MKTMITKEKKEEKKKGQTDEIKENDHEVAGVHGVDGD